MHSTVLEQELEGHSRSERGVARERRAIRGAGDREATREHRKGRKSVEPRCLLDEPSAPTLDEPRCGLGDPSDEPLRTRTSPLGHALRAQGEALAALREFAASDLHPILQGVGHRPSELRDPLPHLSEHRHR